MESGFQKQILNREAEEHEGKENINDVKHARKENVNDVKHIKDN